MKRPPIKPYSTAVDDRPRSDWERVDAKTDADVSADMASDPDWADAMDIDWSTARVVVPEPKTPVSIRIDADVLDYFRRQGRGYQSRINAVLRHYVDEMTRRQG